VPGSVIATAVGAVLLYAAPITAQAPPTDPAPGATTTQTEEKQAPEEKQPPENGRPITMQHFRPLDQRGINIFETPKSDMGGPDEFKVRIGGNFAQQFQSLDHSNNADSVAISATDPTNANRLVNLGPGFNLATANLNIDAQFGDGIRMNMVTYLSARHHQEAWVKGGYIQFDKLPFNGQIWDDNMKVTTIKIGHMEINYVDQHYRRSDGGQTIYNPFVENYIMDAYTTEIGG
jgi:hypothetical protein